MMSMNLSNIAVLNIEGSQKWGHKLNAKCWFDQKTWNIIKHNKFIFVYTILTFGNIEIEKINFTAIRLFYILLKDVDFEEVLVSNKISFGEKTISNLLVTCIMIIELNHYI